MGEGRGSAVEQEIQAEKERNYRFLPDAARLVSSRIGGREDFVCFLENGFQLMMEEVEPVKSRADT